MATHPKTITVTREPDLDALLVAAARAPIVLERAGVRFRLSREDAIDYEPDTEFVRRTLAATVGSWADLDIDAILEDVAAGRRAGTRPTGR